MAGAPSSRKGATRPPDLKRGCSADACEQRPSDSHRRIARINQPCRLVPAPAAVARAGGRGAVRAEESQQRGDQPGRVGCAGVRAAAGRGRAGVPAPGFGVATCGAGAAPAGTPAAAASGAAVRVCHRVRPALVEGLLLEHEHACEAAAMARWGVGAGGANGSGASRGLPRDLSTCGRVLERRLTKAQAAEKLGLSVRQVALVCRKLRAEGPPGSVPQ